MIAEVVAQLPAGIADSSRPMARCRIEHDVRRLDAGGCEDDGTGIYFDFLPCTPVDVGHALGSPVFVLQDFPSDRIGAKLEIPGLFRGWNGEPGRRKKSAYVAAPTAVSTVMARGMAVVRSSQLRAAVREIRNPQLLRSLLHNIVDAAEGNLRQIFPVRIAGPILHRAGHSDHLLNPAEIGRNLFVGNRPVDIKAVQGRRLEIDLAVARRGTAPEIAFPARHLTTYPFPDRARSVHVRDVVLPKTLSEFALVMVAREVRVAKASVLHVIRLQVAAEVLGGDDASA